MTGASNGLINGASAPFASTAGVSTLNGLSGALNIVAGANITVMPSGSSITIAATGGGGGSPGGAQYDVQLNDGAGGFAGSNDLNFQGGYLTINGDSGYGQLQWLNSPLTGGYAGSGISGIDNEIITGALAGDMTFWSSQAMNFSADTGNTNMVRINVDGTIVLSSLTASELTATDASNKLQSLTTATYPSLTEISYVKGVTSAIQTQINSKGFGLSRSITQTAHGFTVQQVLYLNGANYALAKADSVVTAEVIGVVTAVANANSFTLTFGGYITGLSGLTAGVVYFLSPSVAGGLTTTSTSTSGEVNKPLFVADSTTGGYFINYRGELIN